MNSGPTPHGGVSSGHRQVTVLIGESQPLFLDALVRVVRQDPDCALAAEVADGREALRAIRELSPAVALLGEPLDGLSAHRVARATARDRLPTRSILLFGGFEGDAAFRALAAGAAACLTRGVSRDALQRAIAAAARGETVLAPELQSGVAREIRRRSGRPLLTAREREVLALIADGRRTAEIAGELHLSPTTVKTHLGNAYEKLGVSDRAAAVAAGMRRGLLE
jgi:two-component system, NarL family, nitrate/nitrite response regulator NarL